MKCKVCGKPLATIFCPEKDVCTCDSDATELALRMEDELSDEVCCCGDSMKGHPDPMYCGHLPVSQRDHYLSQLPKGSS